MSVSEAPSFQFLPANIKGVHAQRLDSPYIRLFTVVNFLSASDCQTLTQTIEQQHSAQASSNVPSQSVNSPKYLSGLPLPGSPLSEDLEKRISDLLGVPLGSSEPIQGHRYLRGQSYPAQYDWLDSTDPQFDSMPQRSWTFMVYLNDVVQGGETRFDKLGIQFQPSAGLALCWRNLLANGEPNLNALHSSLPVLQGSKYVISKCFLERSGKA